MEAMQCFVPVVTINQIIPFRYQVVYGTTMVALAERHATVHAAGSLGL
jgi:hypothetical protein